MSEYFVVGVSVCFGEAVRGEFVTMYYEWYYTQIGALVAGANPEIREIIFYFLYINTVL